MYSNSNNKIRYHQIARAIIVYIHKYINTGEEKYRNIVIKYCTWYDEETIDSWRDTINEL